jgi:uncharacterized protein (TIGR02001 family)
MDGGFSMTIKKTLIGAASVAALALAATVAPAAAEEREFSWSMTVGGTSDYVFRGLSFTNEDPAAQGSLDMSYGIFYAGAWASNIDGAGFEPWELDLYAGIKPVLGPVTFDFGLVGYLYPAANNSLDYIEFKAGASMELVKSLTGGVTFWFQPDQTNAPEVYTIEGTLAYALPQVGIFEPSVSGLLGYTEDTDNTGFFSNVDDSYVYWNAGLSLTVEKFTMDFRYWDTDLGQNGGVYDGLSDERFVFSAKVTLP